MSGLLSSCLLFVCGFPDASVSPIMHGVGVFFILLLLFACSNA